MQTIRYPLSEGIYESSVTSEKRAFLAIGSGISKMIQVVFVVVLLIDWSSSEQICCNAIGCFDKQIPFDRMPLPMCMEDMKTPPAFLLYTRLNKNEPQFGSPSIIPPNFKPGEKTIFVVHGWINDGDTKWLREIKDALLQRENANVFLVDWKDGADQVYYPQSASNTRTVGAFLSLFLHKLIDTGETPMERIWCIGHSLGAHVCGHAGMKRKIGRITGIDPAGPWFEDDEDLTIGLNPSSANYVDVMHTDNVLGISRPVGHIDFYPNGGKQMPGCLTNTCSHNEGQKYMIESVKKDCFIAYESCTDYSKIPRSCTRCSKPFCAYMGYAAEASPIKKGFMYLETKQNSPFCRG